MCGIIGYIGSKPVVPVLLDGLRRMEYRGYDSAGVALVSPEGIALRRSAGKLANLEATIRTAGPPRRMHTLTAIAQDGSSSFTTASSRTIST
jgi:glucosamine 6-phosphate synthetase-like amidotransferase/phosphosugar isomerase protein